MLIVGERKNNVFVVETLDEDSRDEGCFKNKKVFIEESSSAQTILKVFTQMFFCLIM